MLREKGSSASEKSTGSKPDNLLDAMRRTLAEQLRRHCPFVYSQGEIVALPVRRNLEDFPDNPGHIALVSLHNPRYMRVYYECGKAAPTEANIRPGWLYICPHDEWNSGDSNIWLHRSKERPSRWIAPAWWVDTTMLPAREAHDRCSLATAQRYRKVGNYDYDY